MAVCTWADPGTESILGSVTGACAWESGWRLEDKAQPVDRSEPDGGRRFAPSPRTAAVSAEPNWLLGCPYPPFSHHQRRLKAINKSLEALRLMSSFLKLLHVEADPVKS